MKRSIRDLVRRDRWSDNRSPWGYVSSSSHDFLPLWTQGAFAPGMVATAGWDANVLKSPPQFRREPSLFERMEFFCMAADRGSVDVEFWLKDCLR